MSEDKLEKIRSQKRAWYYRNIEEQKRKARERRAQKKAAELLAKKSRAKTIEPEFIMPTGTTRTYQVPFYHFGVSSELKSI